MANNFGIPGTKLTSRFGMSHKELRSHAKGAAQFYGPSKPSHMSKRKAKMCKHPGMIDDGYGGPESGCMAGHCPRCGYSFHHTLY